MNKINLWQGSSFQILKNYTLTSGDTSVHPKLRFLALDRSQNSRRQPKRNHRFPHTRHNRLLFLWVLCEPHLIIIKINIYWVFTMAKRYCKSFPCITDSLNHHVALEDRYPLLRPRLSDERTKAPAIGICLSTYSLFFRHEKHKYFSVCVTELTNNPAWIYTRQCKHHSSRCLGPSWLSCTALGKGTGKVLLEGHLSWCIEKPSSGHPNYFLKNQGKPEIHPLSVALVGRATTHALLVPAPHWDSPAHGQVSSVPGWGMSWGRVRFADPTATSAGIQEETGNVVWKCQTLVMKFGGFPKWDNKNIKIKEKYFKFPPNLNSYPNRHLGRPIKKHLVGNRLCTKCFSNREQRSEL